MNYPVRILCILFFLNSLPNLGFLSQESLRRIKNLPSLGIELNNRRFLQVGAQRVVTQQGAFTDRTFIGDAKEAGANFSLVYHSETRGDYVSDAQRLGKSVDEVINSEVKALLSNGMTPVICVGETETEKKGGKTREVVKKQVLSALEGLDPKTVAKIVIAYEPLWAITGSGTGIPATPQDAQNIHQMIRQTLTERFGEEAAKKVRILYGGSTNPQNAKSFMEQIDIDGLLVGSASAKLDNFIPMVQIVQELGAQGGRLPIIFGNWKTYARSDDIPVFVEELFKIINPQKIEVGLAPQALHIQEMVNYIKGQFIRSRVAYDSRGKPTIEVVIETEDGEARAKVPAGASTGGNEAATVSVEQALKNAIAIGEQLKKDGFRVTDQDAIDDRMREYDGTSDLRNLGGNTIVGISLAMARAGALAKRLSLWQYIAQLAQTKPDLPLFYMNFLNGGKHSKANLEFQETIVIPDPKRKFTPDKWLEMGNNVFKKLGEILEEERAAGRVRYFDEKAKFGDERGYAPIFAENIKFPKGIETRTEYTLYLLTKAIEQAGYKLGEDFALAWDVAANTLWEKAAEKEGVKPEEYKGGYLFEGEIRTTEWMIGFYKKMVEKYKISSIEDPLSEWDWGHYGKNGWEILTKEIGDKVQLVLDDLTCTNLGILTEAIKQGIGNAILIKTNQNGTLAGKLGTLAVIKLAKEKGYKAVVSHRSGETEDDFIADLAVGVAADGLKTGGLGPQDPMNERLRKYWRVIEIWKEMMKLP